MSNNTPRPVDIQQIASKASSPCERKAYHSPQLTKLGQISSLTRGGGGVLPDGLATDAEGSTGD
jgi:hypothetical protein